MLVHFSPRATARFMALALAAALLSTSAAQAQKKDEFQTSAPYAILIDADSGTVLFEKAADKPNPPASMSKMMTVEVVLHQLQGDGAAELPAGLLDLLHGRALGRGSRGDRGCDFGHHTSILSGPAGGFS